MKTLRYDQPEQIALVADLLKAGQVVGLPTETVYGLAANALDPAAVEKIFAAKNRPADNPLIVHISRWEQLAPLVAEVPPGAKKLADAFWPGPLTMIFPRSGIIPDVVTAGGNTVAVRMPAHPDARAIIEACGLPLAAPSANRSGSPSPTTADHVMKDMDGRIAAVYDGGSCGVGVESTVVDLTRTPARLLRPGGITPEQLRRVLGEVEIDPSVTRNVHLTHVSSPGMKYKHYAPKAQVTLLKGPAEAFCRYVNAHEGKGVYALCFDEDRPLLTVPAVTFGSRRDPAEAARQLFAALRRLDDLGAERVYACCPDPTGVGLAVYNRLIRAAAFDEKEL